MWSDEFNSFVSKCLTVDQTKRPSAFELLNDAFIIKKSKEKFLLNQLVTENMKFIQDFREKERERLENSELVEDSAVKKKPEEQANQALLSSSPGEKSEIYKNVNN
jgi:serine/threonine kinase 4